MNKMISFFLILTTILISSCSIKKKMQRERKLIGISNAYSYLKMDRISEDSIKVYYAMQTEVSNKEYRVFLNYVKHNKAENIYKICAPDSTMWFKTGFKDSTLSDSMFRNYHNHSKFDNHPVVNIHKYAAVLYSEWLTEIDPGGIMNIDCLGLMNGISCFVMQKIQCLHGKDLIGEIVKMSS